MTKNMASSKDHPPSEFSELMDKTGKLFRIPIIKENVQWYWDHLKWFSISKLKKAFEEAIESEEYFPSIACIRKIAERISERREDRPGWPTLKEVKAAEPMGKECIALIQKKLNQEINPDDFYKAILVLHEKYPIKGHEPPLSEFVMKNYRTIESEEPIRPLNFKEAAEMYRLHRERVIEQYVGRRST